MSRRHPALARTPKIIIGVVLFLVAIRIALPWIVEAGANRVLNQHDTLRGHVGDVDLKLWRGACQVLDIEIGRRDPHGSPPFFTAAVTEMSVDWKSLFRGRLLAKGRVTQPVINLAALPVGEGEEAVEEAEDMADQVMPVKISRIDVLDGIVRFPHDPKLGLSRVEITHLEATAEDIRVTDDPSNKTDTKVRATASAPGDGRLSVLLNFDPFSEPVKFNVDARIENVKLPELNPVLRAYLDMDVESGTGSIYAEAKADEGRFQGYVKPIFKDLNVLALGREKATLGQKIKEGLADAVKQVFENQKEDTVGARVPFSGSFDSPSVGVWPAVGTVLRHAFVQALTPNIENRL